MPAPAWHGVMHGVFPDYGIKLQRYDILIIDDGMVFDVLGG